MMVSSWPMPPDPMDSYSGSEVTSESYIIGIYDIRYK
jgi:hypothetical protein